MSYSPERLANKASGANLNELQDKMKAGSIDRLFHNAVACIQNESLIHQTGITYLHKLRQQNRYYIQTVPVHQGH